MKNVLLACLLAVCAPAWGDDSGSCKPDAEDGLSSTAAPVSESGSGAPAREPSPAKLKIREVLASPEFSPEKTIYVPKIKGEDKAPEKTPDWVKALKKFFQGMAEVLRAGVWILAGIGIIILIFSLHYWWRAVAARHVAKVDPLPTRVAGLDIRPETLPDDVGAAARALWLTGDAIGALSLLYRGALSALVTRFAVGIKSSSTEEECLHAAKRTLGGSPAGYFEALTRAWQRTVYAGRGPDDAAALALCDAFGSHFVVRNGAPS